MSNEQTDTIAYNSIAALALTDWLYAWLAKEPGRTGSITINFYKGGITHILTTESHKPEWCRGGK